MGVAARKLMDGAAGSTPVVESITSYKNTSSASTHAVTMPAIVSAGDLLLAICSSRNAAGTWSASGWSILQTLTGAGVLYKTAAGTEGGTTETFSLSGSGRVQVTIRRISGWHGTTPPELQSTNSTTSTNNPNPPSLAPSWGSANTLWIAFFCAINGKIINTTHVTGWPTNYSDGRTINSHGNGTEGVNVSASRGLAASSDDPGAFTLTTEATGNFYLVGTIAVRPTA
jgi:hypothetical protein